MWPGQTDHENGVRSQDEAGDPGSNLRMTKGCGATWGVKMLPWGHREASGCGRPPCTSAFIHRKQLMILSDSEPMRPPPSYSCPLHCGKLRFISNSNNKWELPPRKTQSHTQFGQSFQESLLLSFWTWVNIIRLTHSSLVTRPHERKMDHHTNWLNFVLIKEKRSLTSLLSIHHNVVKI